MPACLPTTAEQDTVKTCPSKVVEGAPRLRTATAEGPPLLTAAGRSSRLAPTTSGPLLVVVARLALVVVSPSVFHTEHSFIPFFSCGNLALSLFLSRNYIFLPYQGSDEAYGVYIQVIFRGAVKLTHPACSLRA